MFWPAQGWLGVDRVCHAVPFHTSASVRLLVDARYWPTAVHELVEVHETPSSELADDPAGFGVCCTVHVVPFHLSASVTCWKVLLLK
jgi:hypothetical protein